MSATLLQEKISALTPVQARQVMAGLIGRLKQRAIALHKDNPQIAAELEDIRDQETANQLLRDLVPELEMQSAALSDVEARVILAKLAESPEFADDVRAAMEHRLLASGVETVLLGTLVVFLLSIDWKIEVSNKSGKRKYSLKATKKATPIKFIRWLLGR